MLSDRWGQTVVVDNRSGGGTVIAAELGVQAPPDGYTILSATDTIMLLGAMKRVTFDIRRALEPVVVMTTQPYILIIDPSLPIRSVKDLIAAIEAFIDGWNDRCQPFTWTKTADELLPHCKPGKRTSFTRH